jgi:hypothetical protein
MKIYARPLTKLKQKNIFNLEVFMKNNVFFVLMVGFIVCAVVSCASLTPWTPPPQYQETVEVLGKSQDEIFVEVNKWFVQTFNNADSVIQYTDKEAGTLSGRYMEKANLLDAGTAMYGAYDRYLRSIITVEVKDGRYRITLNQPSYVEYSYRQGKGFSPRSGPVTITEVDGAFLEYKSQTETLWQSLADSLKGYITPQKSDW